MPTRANTIIAALLFGIVFLIYAVSPVSQSADSFWTVPVMLSVLSAGHTALDDYPQLLREKEYQAVECVPADYRVIPTSVAYGCPAGSHYYYWYSIATPLVALPLMIAAGTAMRMVDRSTLRVAGAHVGAVAQASLERGVLISVFIHDRGAAYWARSNGTDRKQTSPPNTRGTGRTRNSCAVSFQRNEYS
jgi:hypothetical protein